MYINKQTTAKAEFNPNSIENLINMKMTFKNIFDNLIHIDVPIFCLQVSIQIGNISKQEKIYINKCKIFGMSNTQTHKLTEIL